MALCKKKTIFSFRSVHSKDKRFDDDAKSHSVLAHASDLKRHMRRVDLTGRFSFFLPSKTRYISGKQIFSKKNLPNWREL